MEVEREIIQIMPATDWYAIWLEPADPWYLVEPIACWALYRYTDADGSFTAVAPMLRDADAASLDFATIEEDDRWYAWVHRLELETRRNEFLAVAQQRARAAARG